MNVAKLEEFGFCRVGKIPANAGRLILDESGFNEAADLDTLYALVVRDDGDHEVKYIGYTERQAAKRWRSYAENRNDSRLRRVHREIRTSRAIPMAIEIWALQPGMQSFPIQGGAKKIRVDIAASLEIGLIRAFRPPWNKRMKKIDELSDVQERVAQQINEDLQR